MVAMTAAAVILYVVGAVLELSGVWFVVDDFRAQRRAWDAYVADPLTGTVNGLLDRGAPQTSTTWGQLERTAEAVGSLFAREFTTTRDYSRAPCRW